MQHEDAIALYGTVMKIYEEHFSTNYWKSGIYERYGATLVRKRKHKRGIFRYATGYMGHENAIIPREKNGKGS
jgi:hypothetical protein